MVIGPLEDLLQFLPAVHLLIFNLFHRCAGDDHAVIVIVPNILKGLVELIQVVYPGILRLMAARRYECNVQLERRVGEGAQKLKLRVLLERHEIQDHDLKRSDVLQVRLSLIHDKYVLLVQDLSCGQVRLNSNRHL